MTKKNGLKVFPVKLSLFIKRTLFGGLAGLTLITIFLSGAGDPNPEWGKLWMIKPLIIVPLAGAIGGAFNYFLTFQEFRHRWTRTFAFLFSCIVFIIGLWMGVVLGLDGTYWD